VAKVKRQTMADQISDALMDAIMDGTIRMGDKLRTQDLADQFGVSRMPVREALINLQVSGLVDATPYSGYRVVSLDPERIREGYIIRQALEPIVARTACERITDEGVAAVEDKLGELEAATLDASPSPKEIYLCNREFHFTWYEAAGMPVVVEAIRAAWDKLAVYKLIYGRKYLRDREAGVRMVQEHRAYVDALRTRDAEGVARQLEQSIAMHEVDVPDEFRLDESAVSA